MLRLSDVGLRFRRSSDQRLFPLAFHYIATPRKNMQQESATYLRPVADQVDAAWVEADTPRSSGRLKHEIMPIRCAICDMLAARFELVSMVQPATTWP